MATVYIHAYNVGAKSLKSSARLAPKSYAPEAPDFIASTLPLFNVVPTDDAALLIAPVITPCSPPFKL